MNAIDYSDSLTPLEREKKFYVNGQFSHIRFAEAYAKQQGEESNRDGKSSNT